MTTPLEVLRRDGWYKGGLQDARGARCINGALMVAPSSILHISGVILEQFPDRVKLYANGSPSIAFFNDHPDTTFADVELVLEKAQIRYDEAVR